MTAQPAPQSSTGPLAALEHRYAALRQPDAIIRTGGAVTSISAMQFRVRGLSREARMDDLVEIRASDRSVPGQVIQISENDIIVAPFEPMPGVGISTPVYRIGPLEVVPDESWRGRVFDPLGRPLDEGPEPAPSAAAAQVAVPPALQRQRVDQPLRTGVRVVDIFTPLCFGQRIGIFAGSGVGKSTLLAMLAGADPFDTVVVALVGERGREVREFLEDTLGDKALAKTVAIVATSDESAMMRRRAPLTAMRVAEHFRDRGHKVLVVLDSITRYAHALREVATAAGEPPIARGYPASVFTELPRLLERAGPGAAGMGSITAILSVLVDGDDHNDPVADAVRGILDGHIVLDRAIAEQGRFPAVDPLASISRLSGKVWKDDERMLVQRLRAMISRFEDTRDIRLLGGYQAGSDGELDAAVRQIPAIYEALKQTPSEGASPDPFQDLARHLKAREQSNG